MKQRNTKRNSKVGSKKISRDKPNKIHGKIERDNSSQHKKQDVFAVNKGVRLNKYIADCGVASRRKADEIIESGAVKVNRNIIREFGYKVVPGDSVYINGDPISPVTHNVYMIMNKPKNVITTTHDDFERRTIMDLIKVTSRVYPIGRLDRNTTGLLLLTNDGEFAYRLTHPKYKIERIYSVKLDKPLEPEDAEKIVSGLMIDGKKTAPCEVFIMPENHHKVIITLVEGKNHEVKKLFEKVGYDVKQLDRKVFANLSLSGLQRGDHRHLREKEVKFLKRLVGMI